MAAARRILLCIALAVLVLPVRALGGTMEHESPVAGGQVDRPAIDFRDFAPGQSRSSTLVIANAGRKAGRFVLSADAHGSSPLARSLRLSVSDNRGRVLYRGQLAGASTNLGVLAAGESHRYRLTVSLPASASGIAQGQAVSPSFTWAAAGV